MNDPIECETCGATHGSFTVAAGGRWLCLAHLPRLGAEFDRRQGGRQAR
jgi:hypothetical protein